MESLQDCMIVYKNQLKNGTIGRAYKGLMEYILSLRTHFAAKFPDYAVSGSIYFGYMDMTYFSIFPGSLKDRQLKIAIVFLHEAFRFEVWLSGVNKSVQSRYWKLIKENGWEKYHVVSTTQGADSIVEHVLVEHPDFDDPSFLTAQIESGTLKFIKNVENFLIAIKVPS